jgi:hypothetical protein
MKKIISQLDATGFYIGPTIADESPLEPDIFLIPSGAIAVPPPDIEAPAHHRILWTGSSFDIVENPRPAQPSVEDGAEVVWNAAEWQWDVTPPPEPAAIPEPEPVPPTIEEQAATARAMRTALISQTDWTQLPDAPLTTEQKAAWVTYRQALRDITEQTTFPETIDWPVAP